MHNTFEDYEDSAGTLDNREYDALAWGLGARMTSSHRDPSQTEAPGPGIADV